MYIHIYVYKHTDRKLQRNSCTPENEVRCLASGALPGGKQFPQQRGSGEACPEAL